MHDHSLEHAGSSPRYQMLDVWRGVVSVVVVLEHAGVALWEKPDSLATAQVLFHDVIVRALRWNVGTPLFFVMSGYCIAASLVSSQRKGGTPLGFLARRLWRIYPTYWAALLGFVVFVIVLDAIGLSHLHNNGLSQAIGSPLELNLAQWVGNLTLTETWRPKLGGGESWVFTRVAWSLCYQEQFYVVCVLVLWLAPTRIGRSLAVLSALIVMFRVAVWDAGALHRVEGLFPIYWHEFAVGLAVYWRLTATRPSDRLCRRSLELFLAGMLVATVLEGDCISTIAASGFGLLLIALHRWDNVLGRLDWLAPIRACGKRSYSIYLTHLPVVAVGNPLLAEMGLTGFWLRLLVLVPVVSAASIGVGWAFHHAVERQFLTTPVLFSRLKLGAPKPQLTALPA